ncbi:hypothetical protein BBJ28_00017341 [Nothophytophthora sp. Chile5]|nr:hypothetical protein BBJ28_00017341 [Nothophytophthora sp. Chile5]
MGGFMRAFSRSAVAFGAATVAVGVAYGVHCWNQRRNHQERPRDRSTQRRRAATRSRRRERQDVRLQARKLARGDALALQRVEMTEEQRREQRESIRMRRVEQYVRTERIARETDLLQGMSSLHEAPVELLYRPEELVYLSPDADDVLSVLDPTRVYVVGGIVDRSVRKGQTMAKATAQGLRTARLPLQEHFAQTGEAVRTHILNLDSVLIILNEVANHGDWGRAFQRAVPPRITRRKGDKKAEPLNYE